MPPLNKKAIRVIKLEDLKSDYAYWSRQSPEARLAALEEIRDEYNNWKYHDRQGKQRIFRVVKQDGSE